jgi:hypothetical protein
MRKTVARAERGTKRGAEPLRDVHLEHVPRKNQVDDALDNFYVRLAAEIRRPSADRVAQRWCWRHAALEERRQFISAAPAHLVVWDLAPASRLTRSTACFRGDRRRGGALDKIMQSGNGSDL